jgi:hypothetical protein
MKPMPKVTCKKDHSVLLDMLGKLPESQAVIRGRHRCAGCAYEKGFQDGMAAARRGIRAGTITSVGK